jgi:hypothetical protein
MQITERTEKAPRTKGKPRSLEALAFYLGAHKIDPDTVAAEIEAGFDADVAREQQKVLAHLRTLEANVEEVRRRLPEAESVWERVKSELGDTPPPAAEAVAMSVLALFALALDAIFIAPSMDLMNVTDEAWQFVAGAGLAVLCTLFFHMTGSVLVARKSTRLMKSIAGMVGACGILSLVVWGLLRGYQLGFSAMLAGNPLGQFLATHPVLTSIFYTFVTLATPLVGAAASIHAWRSVRVAREWRRAHDAWETLRAQEVQLAKQIQKAEDELAHLETLADAHRREWNAVLAQFYHRGMKHGARQETLISVIRKSAFAGLCTAPVFLFAAVVPVVTLVTCPVVAGIGAFAWLNHRRIHPSHERYLKQENTQFAVPDRGFVPVLPPPSKRLLTKGDSE